MDKHFIDANGNYFVAVDVPDGYERDGATEVEAPPSPSHRWTGGGWEIPLPPQLTLAERRAVLVPRLSQKRYEVETGGVEVMGISVRTDEVGQSKLTGAMVAMDNDETLVSIDWEAQPGVWVTLDKPTISGLSYVVARHVQACFSRARVVSEAIVAASTHAAMDGAEAAIEQGWP